MSPVTLSQLVRLAGASLLALAAFHAVLWRGLGWGGAVTQLSPLTARVFVVHLFFVTFVLALLGLLSAARPELLVAPSELGRLLAAGIVLFWLARLAAQPFVFDPVMEEEAARPGRPAWLGSPLLRAGATLLWGSYVAIYGAVLMRQLEAAGGPPLYVGFEPGAPSGLRIGIAAVWILFGLVFKALGVLPRHKAIVARVVGERAAGPMTSFVAAGEVCLGLWMLSGRWLPGCAAVQTLALVAMNALELRYARDLLVSPVGMVVANVVFLGAGWYVALR